VAQIPSIGRIVQYSLDVSDAEQIMRRRTVGGSIAARMAQKPPMWPAGAQAHIGNMVAEGDIFPMLIIRVWGPNEDGLVNGQVFLDGNDVFWAMSVKVGEGPGTFSWPART
jgi:hypothetical protein